MSDRTGYMLQLNIVKQRAGSRSHSGVIRGTDDDTFETGAILTLKANGRAATLPVTIDGDIDDPVKYLALADFDGDATEYVSLEEIDSDTVLACQCYTSTVTADDIGKQGYLLQDATSGHYAVLIDDEDPSIEIVDVEPNFQPYGKGVTDDYNIVWFKFLDAVLDIAPQAVS